MANNYRVNITEDINPARADVSTLAKINEAAVVGERSKNALAESFSRVGADIFSGVYKAYDTQQKEKKVTALGKDIETGVSDLQSQMDEITAMDTSNKTKAELERAQMAGNQEEIRAGAMLIGADPAIANQVANVFVTQNENKFLSNFREEQQRIMLARDAMPQRQHEMMLRSEALLKKAIAETPELANNFRQVAQQVTGKERVDLYSVNKLYEDINFIEKQKQEAGKAAQKQEDMMRIAYVNDRKQAGNVSETQALLEWQQKSPKDKFELAQLSVENADAIKQADAALKRGGDALLNLTTLSKAKFDSSLVGENASILSRIKLLGVSRQQIAAGQIPADIANSPAYKALIDEAGTKILTLLDEEFKSTNDKLIERMRSVPADAAKAREAQNDLKTWYEGEKKRYTENKTSWLIATSSEGDYSKTVKQRLDIVNSLVQTLGLPPDVIASLGMTGDTKGYNDARARYPIAAKSLDHFAKLREAAMKGVPDQDWIQLMKDVDSFKTDKAGTAPVTKTESVASLVTYQQLAEDTRKASVDKTMPIDNPSEHILKQLNAAFADPQNTEMVLKRDMTAITAFIKDRIPEADKEGLINLINLSAERNVYGELAHGDAAKLAYDNSQQYYSRYASIGINLGFKDATGAGPLVAQASRPISVPSEDKAKLAVLQDWQRVGSRPPVSVGQLNARLSAVDDALKVQAQLTGVSIFKLRTDFINVFNSSGSVSQAYTAQTVAKTQAIASGSMNQGNLVGVQPVTPTVIQPTDNVPATVVPIATLSDAQLEAQRLKYDADNEKGTVMGLDVTSSPPPAVPPAPVTSNVPADNIRKDGTAKGNGYLGVLKASDGKDVTEFSTSSSDVKVKGKAIEFPIIVPTLTKEEVNLLLTDIIPNNKKNIPDAIMNKAIDHARMRIKEGKSVFAETGDYKPTKVTPTVTKPRSQREAIGKLEPLPKTDKPAVTPAKPSGGNLKVGDVVNGFTYTGGDPNNSSSWKQ